MGKVIFWAAVGALLGVAANSILTLVGERIGWSKWVVGIACTVGVAIIGALVKFVESGRDPSRTLAWTGVASLVVALVIAYLVFGLRIPDQVKHGVQYITGNEPGREILKGARRASVGGLTLRVVRVERTTHFTRVLAEMHNTSPQTIQTHVNGDLCELAGGGKVLHTNSWWSRAWTEELAPGDYETNNLVFSGHLPASAEPATLSFTEIVGGPDSISVRYDTKAG